MAAHYDGLALDGETGRAVIDDERAGHADEVELGAGQLGGVQRDDLALVVPGQDRELEAPTGGDGRRVGLAGSGAASTMNTS